MPAPEAANDESSTGNIHSSLITDDDDDDAKTMTNTHLNCVVVDDDNVMIVDQPVELAGAYVFLASNEANYVVGKLCMSLYCLSTLISMC